DPISGQLFSDDFSHNGTLSPWIIQTGTWADTNGVLQGGPNPATGNYGNVYITNSFTNYSVQAQFQFSAGAYGAGLGMDLNPLTGSHYAAWIYPIGNVMNVIRFSAWQTPTFLATLNLPAIGTSLHTLKLATYNGQLAIFYDGTQVTNIADNTYLSGG